MKGLFWGLSLIGLAAAQTATPSNISDYSATEYGVNPVKLEVANATNSGWIWDVVPLTAEAYNRLPHGQHDVGYINSTVVLNTPGSTNTATNLRPIDIAYTSCDPQDYTGNIDMTTAISNAITANVTGILLYSKTSKFCNVPTYPENWQNYANIYSLTGIVDSRFLFNLTSQLMVNNMAQLQSAISLENQMSQGPLSSLGGSGTTAVAMIILYSITGVITCLFLVIIITGAIRAHRHPERYGPRNIMGRPRQSRAKGIARAMLDTLPIVKFGEQKPEQKDVEQTLTDGQSHELANREVNGTTGPGTDAAKAATTAVIPVAAAGAASSSSTEQESSPESAEPNTSSHDAATSPVAEAQSSETEDNQGCSICTDDFERGQEVRVLPCNHQFHPACVDPWLLDVSGTCPLCRVDLNPGSSNTNGDELPPPVGGDNALGLGQNGRRRGGLRAFLAGAAAGAGAPSSNGLHSNDREARLAALRRWRNMNRNRNNSTTSPSSSSPDATPSNVDGAQDQQEEAQQRSRLGKFSRLMRRR